MAIDLAAQGGNMVQGWPQGWDQRDVMDKLVTLDSHPSNYALDQLLRASNMVKNATNVVQEYYRRDAEIPATTTLTAASAGSAAGDTQTLPVALAAIFLVDEKVAFTVGGQMRVGVITGVNYTANTIEVGTFAENPAAVTNANYRTPRAFASGPVVGDGSVIYRLGPAKSEYHGPSGTNRNLSQGASNLIASYDCQVIHSTLALKTGNYTEREMVIYEREKKESYRRAINRDLYLSKKSIHVKDGKLVFTFDGLLAHDLPTFSTPAASLDEGTLIDLAYAATEDNAGSQNRIILAGGVAKKALDKVLLNKMEHTEDRTRAGMSLKEIAVDDITLGVTRDRTLDSLGMGNRAFMIDPAHQVRAEMEAYNEVDLSLRESGTADGQGKWGFEKFCPLFTMPEACLDITIT